MDKKIRDILPPKKSVFVFEEKRIKPSKKNKKIFIYSLIFLFVLSVFYSFAFSKAEIEIWPQTENFNMETELILDESVKEIFHKEKVLIDTFKSSGEILKEKKAEGMIKIYNEHSSSPQTLVATTRFVSADGKVFRIQEKVIIPGGTYEKGKFVAGEIEVKIFADQPGPEYNIQPTTFSIPGFAGTDRYLKFYAKSFQTMQGGFQEKIAIVLKQDLDNAEQALIKKAEQECHQLLKSELEEKKEFDYSLKNIKSEIIEKFSSTSAGEEKEEFNFQIKIKCETLLFEKEYFKDYAEKIINQEISIEKKLVEQSLKLDYSLEENDSKSAENNISLNISARIYSDINVHSLKNALIGKSFVEAELFLKNQPEILKTNIKLSPFWVRKVPQNLDKIELFLRFD